MQNLKKYFEQFEKEFSKLEKIDAKFYEDFGVTAFCSSAKSKDSKGNPSEEWIRARFVWSIVQSGMYDKENICVEFNIPKGNHGKAIKPDVVVFKSRTWLSDYEEAKKSKNFSKIRQDILVIFETKNHDKSIDDAMENQLRSAMNENESEERIFGIYFDDRDGVLIFKKIGNSPIRRFYENKELEFDGIGALNYGERDLLSELPSQKDFVENNESIANPERLKLEYLDAIDESNFTDVLNSIKRSNDKIQPKTPVNLLVVEFLTLKVFDEKRSQKNNDFTKFYITEEEKENRKVFRERIDRLYKDAKREYPKVLSKPYFEYDSMGRPKDINDELFLIEIVEVFQKRAILKTKNESFNQIIFNNFGSEAQKADKGQFFTPIPVVKTIIKMLNPRKNEVLCDPCCGICDFPAMAFRHANRAEIKNEDFFSNRRTFLRF